MNQSFGNNAIAGVQLIAEQKESPSVYGEPNYVKTEDQFGQETWVNEGGFGMHRNICDPTRLIERKEYFDSLRQTSLFSPGGNTKYDSVLLQVLEKNSNAGKYDSFVTNTGNVKDFYKGLYNEKKKQKEQS